MPQPIDPQTEIGRATTAERIQQIADRASLAGQARATEESSNVQRSLETEVHQTAAKSDEVNRETRRRNPFVVRRKKRKQGGQKDGNRKSLHLYDASEKEVLADEPQAHDFDVEI